MRPNAAIFWVLVLAVAGCAATAASPAPRSKHATEAELAGIGVILVIHWERPEGSPAVRMLFRECVGSAAADVESIVRARDGATIAIVPSAIQRLRRGDRVRIARRTPPAIEPKLYSAAG